MHVRDMTEEEFDQAAVEARLEPDQPRRVYDTLMDPLSQALDCDWFATRITELPVEGKPGEIEYCQETFENSLMTRTPERFDRLYFAAAGGPLLVDILDDGSVQQREQEHARKRCEFKEGWCRAHGRRYLAIGSTEAMVPQRVAELLAAVDAPPVAAPLKRGPGRPRKHPLPEASDEA